MLDRSGSYLYAKEKNGHHVFFDLNDNIKAHLEVPFNSFEWKLDIVKGKYSVGIRYWIDLNKVSKQIALERYKEDLKLVCDNLILCPSKFIVEWRWPNLIKRFQIYKNEKWGDMIMQTKKKWI